MGEPVTRLLCIDLQVDRATGLSPAPQAIFGARQLLIMGRRLGWTVVHTRRRLPPAPPAEPSEGPAPPVDVRAGAMRPLMTERVFFRNGRSVLESGGLCRLLDSWRNETLYVAGFDHVAVLSSLLACYETGPRIVLVDDVVAMSTLPSRATTDAFGAAARHLGASSTTIAEIAAEADGRAPPVLASLPPSLGVRRPGMPV
jgi:nicotinamidase-related amidase